jgi:peptidoglycan/LPS O-acetylase OafA/YrhL
MAHPKIPAPSLQTIDQELDRILHTKVISGLDAVRAVAVSLVLLDHFMVVEHLLGLHFALGSLGVMIFFVLSGFLITSMLLKEYRRTGGISFSNFYRRRAYRIFPTFYCCWILTTVIEYLAHQLDWKMAAASFFYYMDYWRAFGPTDTHSNMFISWSLAVEEKFYLLWPLLLLFLLRKQRILIRCLSAVILGQWVYRAILYLVFHVRWGYVYYPFEMRVDALLDGCLLAVLLHRESTRLLCCRLLTRQWLSLLPPLALVLLAIAPPSNKPVFLLFWSIQPVVVGVMLLQAVYWGAKSWTISSSAVVRVTANLSYALYLYHPLAGKIVYLLHIPHVGYATVLLTLTMSSASYYLIETPFMRMRDRHRAAEASVPAVPVAST